MFAFSGYLDFQHPADRDKQTSNSTRICSICPNELRLKPDTTEHLYFDQPDHNRPPGHFRPIYGVFHEKKKKKALKSRLDQVFRLWCADSTFQTALLMHAGLIIFLAVVSIAIIGWQKKKWRYLDSKSLWWSNQNCLILTGSFGLKWALFFWGGYQI